ncbi:tyrosine-type recombinase/integrase [Bacillus massiliglaciei]|uniref:tyrosine-type recombinase/integrase n=1 Tax=Bacillus massiliglaciei TaxID=1816693 RepID=UPI000B307E9E|nr:tyrosine-type recombinase/integrase [Bacillus massiliglaciei]
MIIKIAVNDFLEERKHANLSPYTIKTYKRILIRFVDYCINIEGIADISRVNRDIIKRYLNYLRSSKNNGPRTINSKLRILKVFFNYAVAEDMYEAEGNIFKNIRYAKIDDRISTFSDKHLQQILKYFDKESRNKPFHAYRNKILTLTMLSAGLRRGELSNLRWEDVDFQNRLICVFGKKRKVLSIPIANKLSDELVAYYVYLKEFFDGEPGPYVFCSTSKEQITADTIGSVFKRLSKKMNFDDVRLSAHTFRHTFASRAIKKGMDTITLQRMLRHESTQMTERYVNMWGSDLREKNEKYNPLNDIEI